MHNQPERHESSHLKCPEPEYTAVLVHSSLPSFGIFPPKTQGGKTLQAMNQFKLATGVDVTKLVAYSVCQLFKLHPELKIIIKQFFQKLDE